MNTTGMVSPSFRAVRTYSRQSVYSTLFANATCYSNEMGYNEWCDREVLTVFDPWIVGPSPMGSENGTPSSIISAPPACIASMVGMVASLVGKPAVTNVMKTLEPYRG
jgi:hypothetical protein